MQEGIEPEAGGHDLTILVDTEDPETEELHIFLPGNVPPHIKGDGLLPLGLLTEIVTCLEKEIDQPQVEVKLEPGEFFIAAELAVIPFEISGTVVEVNNTTREITLDGERTIQVYPFATVIDENSSLVGIEGIEIDDDTITTITSHGLESCDYDITQISFVISVQEEAAVVVVVPQ